ncbi:MAG: hypothetical protein II670_07200, partial [Alphaproteobacteria bacterium]|nr:hypothetical protein [Alphaproteobacteria bacterium]
DLGLASGAACTNFVPENSYTAATAVAKNHAMKNPLWQHPSHSSGTQKQREEHQTKEWCLHHTYNKNHPKEGYFENN